MTKKPYVFGTPEYVAWAKKGEQEGEVIGRFDELVDELCDLVGNNEIKSADLAQAGRKIAHFFGNSDACECECDCY